MLITITSERYDLSFYSWILADPASLFSNCYDSKRPRKKWKCFPGYHKSKTSLWVFYRHIALRLFIFFFAFSSLPSPGQGAVFEQLFSLSVFEAVCELGTGRSGCSWSDGSLEMALLSSSMGAGLAALGGCE